MRNLYFPSRPKEGARVAEKTIESNEQKPLMTSAPHSSMVPSLLLSKQLFHPSHSIRAINTHKAAISSLLWAISTL